MAGFSDYLENKVLDHVTGKTAFNKPTSYVALSTADPKDDVSTLAEPAGANYQRVTTAGADWNAANAGSVTNANAITFPQASGSWGTITYVALFDSASPGGNMLLSGTVSPTQAVAANNTISFPAGTLTLSLD